ncbi:arylesterase [Altererythrobacter sp.]|nr:arylesterase [Altererythrobacter sp.]
MEQGKWPMAYSRLSISLIAVALAACGAEAPVADPARQAESGSPSNAEVPVMGPEKRILAFGDSLFAGYNVAKSDSYPAKLEVALRAQGVNARVTNAGVSGDTSAAGLQRFAFALDAMDEAPDLLILELGGNDLLRGVSPAETKSNLEAMIKEAQSRGIAVLLMGIQSPPNMGADFVNAFNGLYPALAEQYDTQFIPFWVESVADKPELIQADRIHPTEDGIEVLVKDTLDEVVAALPEGDT